MKQIYRIDSNGYYVPGEDNYIEDSLFIPDGYIDIKPMIDNGDETFTGYFKAKWTGSEWSEGYTQEQINALNQPQPPSRLDLLEQAVNDLILNGGTP